MHLLRRRAEFTDHRADQFEAKHRQGWRASDGAFFLKHIFLRGRPSGPAMFLGPKRREPALFVQQSLPFSGDIGLNKDTGGIGRTFAQTRAQLIIKKRTYFITECQIACGKTHIHQSKSPVITQIRRRSASQNTG